MKILVTGSLGYIGTVLTRMLVREGFDVTGLDAGFFRNNSVSRTISDVPTIRKDVRDVALSDVAGFDAIIHLAAISNDPLGDLNPECTYSINYRASVRLAQIARRAGVPRFLFASSCSLYGKAGHDGLLDERSPFNPVSPYGESKILAEQEIAGLASKNFSPTFLRCATAYGYSPRLRLDVVVNNLVAYAVTHNQVLLRSDGSAWRPLVHVRDICRAYLEVLAAPRDAVHNEAFNIGSTAENYRIRDVACIVQQAVPQAEIRFPAEASADARCYRVDFQKIHTRLPGFRTRWTVKRGADELCRQYRRYRLKSDDLLGPRFLRLEHIKQLIAGNHLDAELRLRTEPACA